MSLAGDMASPQCCAPTPWDPAGTPAGVAAPSHVADQFLQEHFPPAASASLASTPLPPLPYRHTPGDIASPDGQGLRQACVGAVAAARQAGKTSNLLLEVLGKVPPEEATPAVDLVKVLLAAARTATGAHAGGDSSSATLLFGSPGGAPRPSVAPAPWPTGGKGVIVPGAAPSLPWNKLNNTDAPPAASSGAIRPPPPDISRAVITSKAQLDAAEKAYWAKAWRINIGPRCQYTMSMAPVRSFVELVDRVKAMGVSMLPSAGVPSQGAFPPYASTHGGYTTPGVTITFAVTPEEKLVIQTHAKKGVTEIRGRRPVIDKRVQLLLCFFGPFIELAGPSTPKAAVAQESAPMPVDVMELLSP